jgi:hypothetical protein
MRYVFAALVFVALIVALPGFATAQDDAVIPLDVLLAQPETYSGRTITIEGELVGDYGFRSDGTMWTQLNDDSYARDALVDGGPRTGGNTGVGVRMPDALAAGLDPPGGYRLEGPLVRATGTWKYHDPDRGGESYLDVSSLDVVEVGRQLEEGPDWVVLAAGIVVLAFSLGLWLADRRDG